MSKAEASNPPSAAGDASDRYAIDAVVHALMLLERFTQRDSVALAEAVSIVGTSRSTAYRLLVTLERSQLIDRLPEGGYCAGQRLIAWSASLMSQIDVRRIVGPQLRTLWEETGETVNLAILRNTGLIYTDILESASTLRMADSPGSSVPLHATALGKAIAAYLDPPRLAQYLGSEPYEAFTPRTCTTWAQLLVALTKVRSKGYAVDVEERAPGVACVAAPILVDGRPVAAISVSGPRIRFESAQVDQIGSRVAQIARDVAERLSPTWPAKTAISRHSRAASSLGKNGRKVAGRAGANRAASGAKQSGPV